MASSGSAAVAGRLTSGNDNMTGTGADEIFEVPSSNSNLSANDTITGGGGHDAMVFERTSSLGVNYVLMPNVTGIEEFDVTAASSVVATLNDAIIDQAESDTLCITFDGDPLALDMRNVLDPAVGRVEVWGTGTVTLYDAARQAVHVGDIAGGTVIGGSGYDTISGGTGNDTLTGNAGDDSLTGGNGADSLTGGDDQDRLEGGGGNDTLSGGAGYDLLTGGEGSNTVSGGTESDTFVVSSGETLTITDFDVSDVFERIDLRGLDTTGMTIADDGGDTLITLPGEGTTIRLTGVASSAVSNDNFLFTGDTRETLAQALSTAPDFGFTAAADNFTGTAADEVFEVKGQFSKLDANDTFNGGDGIDTLRVWGTNRELSAARIPGISGIEIIDLSAADGTLTAEITSSMVASSDSGTILVRFGPDAINVQTDTVADASKVIVEGTGTVTLRDRDGQGVTISDHYNGTVLGRNKDDTVIGGAADDTISGSGGDDMLSTGGGSNLLSGGEGFDTLTSSGTADTLTGGADTDQFVITSQTGAQAVTITDFGGAAAYEYIDLTAFAVFAFGDMTIVDQSGDALVTLPDGTTILLQGVAAAALSAADFILPGQDVPQRFQLTSGADTFAGTAANDLIDFIGQQDQFDATEDTLDGGGGIDTLRIFGDSRLLGDGNLPALNRVEVIDMTNATGSHSVTLTDADAQQSDTGTITLKFGATPIDLNVGHTANAGQVIVEGAGPINLSSGTQNQKVTSGAAGATINAGNDDTIIIGGSGDDAFTGDMGDDFLEGNGGDDTISGGAGDDTISGGTGADTLDGGGGRDLLTSGAGVNQLTGGTETDSIVISANAEGTILTDYEADNYAERIDVTEMAGLNDISDLTIVAEGSHARVTGTGLDLLIQNTDPADLDATDFILNGQDPLIFNVAAGATTAQLQQLFSDAPAGAVINLAAGTYTITETLRIDRGDITVRGAGENQTIFRTEISDANAGQTILVQPEDVMHRHGSLGVEVTEGSNQVQLPVFDLAALQAVDSTIDYTPFEVGDLVFLFQPNDAQYLTDSGNTAWNEPVPTDPVDAENYYLREFRSRIVAIDENGVATLAEAAPYTFEAGTTNVGKSPFLSDVVLSDFSIEGSWGTPDHYLFENTMADWASIAALELDGVRDSHIENITITNPAAHGFKWQRAHETTADNLTAFGAHNKAGSSGYHFLLHESFANDFDNLSSTYARHAVLFNAFNAEHFNDIHVEFTNRDINFHGSADDENTIVVDRMEQDYPDGVLPQWRAVHPGNPGEHPESDIEGNDVTFKYAETGERADKITAHVDGARAWLNLGSDEFIGQDGDDEAYGQGDNDTLRGNGGNDTLSGNEGRDSLTGGDGNDIMRGGSGEDTLRGGDGEDTLIGGGDVDTLVGGSGRDTFIRSAADGTDFITDFEAGGGGDTFVITGSAYTKFSQLQFVQNGADVELLFGPAGMTVFENILIADLASGNFAFDGVKVSGQNVTLDGTEFFAAGTTGNDTFNVSRPHMERASFAVRGGKGTDTVAVAQSSLFGDLGATGTYNGIEAFDLSAITTIGISIEDALVQQSGNRALTLHIGDSGTTIGLDSAKPTQQYKLIIDGSREVQLNGGRDHKIYSSDNAGGNIIGDDGHDTIKGGDMNDTFEGGAGRDRLFAGLGDDSLSGGDGGDDIYARGGDDTLDGGAGGDFMSGGGGSDFYKLDNLNDVMFEKDIWSGHDVAHVSVDGYVLTKNAYVEEVHLKGDSTLSITGNQADTHFIGNAQDNVISGDRGADTIEGGAGADTFLFNSKIGTKHIDTISDFNSGEGDVLHLDDAIFTGLAPGMLSASAFHIGAAAADADDRIIYNQATGELFFDVDGTGSEAAVKLADFTGLPALAASDFEII